jgi:hypothetical protein
VAKVEVIPHPSGEGRGMVGGGGGGDGGGMKEG